jgi:flagellar motility protein MotE (MotC chaperone)
MKVVGYILLGLFSFIVTIAVAGLITGDLSKAGIDRLMGKAPEEQAQQPRQVAAEAPDPLSDLAKALNQREQAIKEREERVAAREARLAEDLAQLEELRGQVQTLLKEAASAVDQTDAQEIERMQAVAASLGEMSSEQAARTIEQWPPDYAARVLRLIDDRPRGKILDAMAADKASVILRAMQGDPQAS